MNHHFQKALRTSKNIHKRKLKKRSAKSICKNIIAGLGFIQKDKKGS